MCIIIKNHVFLSKTFLGKWFLDIFKMSNFVFLEKSFLKKTDFLVSKHYGAAYIFGKTGPLHKLFLDIFRKKTTFCVKRQHFAQKKTTFCANQHDAKIRFFGSLVAA
jgi:hypothetical protein